MRKVQTWELKALYLLTPDFFPLWDEKIARAYGCYSPLNLWENTMLF
jgi:hypothetical protein